MQLINASAYLNVGEEFSEHNIAVIQQLEMLQNLLNLPIFACGDYNRYIQEMRVSGILEHCRRALSAGVSGPMGPGPKGFMGPIGPHGPMGPHGPVNVYGLVFCRPNYVGSAGSFRTLTYYTIYIYIYIYIHVYIYIYIYICEKHIRVLIGCPSAPASAAPSGPPFCKCFAQPGCSNPRST